MVSNQDSLFILYKINQSNLLCKFDIGTDLIQIIQIELCDTWFMRLMTPEDSLKIYNLVKFNESK